MKEILKKIELINYKYSLVNETKFNIFEVLRDKKDEVYLHSRFIYEILRNNGNHKFGSKITRSFLDYLGIQDIFILDNYSVHREYKDIDILIRNDNQAIIIENKIGAEDQPRQLERYYEIIKNENFKDIFIFYLTPFGKEPSDNSLGFLNIKENTEFWEIINNEKRPKVSLISYEFHISNWLEICIEITSKNANLRETLIQYQDLIDNITGKSTNMEQRMEIYKLLSESNNMESAYTIASNWKHIRWHTEWDFWNSLQEKIKSERITILNEQKFSAKNLNSVIHQSRNRNPWYGIKFELSEYKGNKVYLMVQRGKGQVIYGIKTNIENVQELSNLINGYCEFNVMQNWCCRNHFEPSIDFESFSNKDTLHLSNEKERIVRVEIYWKQIKELIEHYENIIKSC